MRKIKNFVFHSWLGGRYWDRWMINHTLSGMVLGLALRMAGVSLFWAIAITFIVAILWELFEAWKHIFEPTSNTVIDVVVAVVGFFVTYSFVPTFGLAGDIALLVILVLLSAILNFVGWHSWLARKNK